MRATELGALIAGRYELGAVLRRGGMADVHTGVDRRLERQVAIKVLRPDMADRQDVRLRFEAEARSAASLSHPCVVAVYDTGEHDGIPYIVMERLPGRTLADKIADDGRVDPEWLLPAAAGILSALGAAHDAAIVHRDVKPGNILLTDSDTAKISDFGIAKSAELASGSTSGALDLTMTGQLIGTPAYLAPERLAGAPATFLSDLYSMGVVLYEALTGEKPFTGASFVAVAQAVQEGAHRPLVDARPDLDPDVAAAVERAMHRDPSRRFSSAEAMSQALTGGGGATTTAMPLAMDRGEETTVLAAEALTATQVTEAAPLALPPHRRRVPLAVPLGLAAALLIGLLLALAGAGGGSDPSPVSSTASSTTPTTPSTVAPTTVPSVAPAETTPRRTTTPPRQAPKNRRGNKGNNKD